MAQLAIDTCHFFLGRPQYRRVIARSWLFLGSFLGSAVLALVLSALLWKAYTHTFTPYLKWQDALVALLWFIAFATFGGCVMVVRFQCAVHAGYRQGMFTLTGDNMLTVRDLSHENLMSIFWMINSTFWCFVALLVGLVPVILLEWTLRIPQPALAFLATALAVLLSLAGLIVSLISTSFIVIGCIGAFSFCRKLGSSHTYQLVSELTLRIDNFVLTITYPEHPETLIELKLFEVEDQRRLLSLLYTRWNDAQAVWNPTLGEEIELALARAKESTVLV
ncbi:MAG TPA: hypothetical protein VHZ51_16490 [Ktedonobacteraceae bacterium]|jgi:hypothetical protein|nr:hypothetical protein [Ktedonobacteraceae bacterium]